MGELKPKKNQVYIQTWHAAGAFKKFGLDIIESEDDRDHEKLAWRKEAQNWDYLLCSSEEVREIYLSLIHICLFVFRIPQVRPVVSESF